VDILPSPFDAARVNERFAELEGRGQAQLERDGIAPAAARRARSADIRYKGQINEVEVAVPGGLLDAAALGDLVADFTAGTRHSNRVEIVTCRVHHRRRRQAGHAARAAGRHAVRRRPCRHGPLLGELGDFAPPRCSGATARRRQSSRGPPSSRFGATMVVHRARPQIDPTATLVDLTAP
jgi:hypothetical protein